MQTPKDINKLSKKPTADRSNPKEPQCTKTCGSLSRLDPKRCICVQIGIGPENTTFNPRTGTFDRNKEKPLMKKGGSLIKGSSARRQASIKGLRTSRKHK